MKTNIIVWLVTMMCGIAWAQESLSLSAHHDTRLGTIGSDYSKAGTIDLILKFNMQGMQQCLGYMTVSPEFEYAKLEGDYYRYGALVGYTFNRLTLERVELFIQGGYGFINHYGNSTGSFGGYLGVNYEALDLFKLSAQLQGTDRSDLGWMYGDRRLQFSVSVGIEIHIFDAHIDPLTAKMQTDEKTVD